MRGSRKACATALVGIFTGIGFAYAGNVHLKQNRNPSFIDQGLSLNAQGALAGLGNGDIVILLTARANVIATCTNPSGSNQPPGRNPAPITVAGSQAIPQGEIKNGTVAFNVSTRAPSSTITGAPDCPNSQWTETIHDLKFTQATMTVEQPPPNVKLTVVCTFSPPTVNGPVPAGNVSCQQSSSSNAVASLATGQ